MASNGVSKTPPTLPPSVEESYKRKCIQLKSRMNTVEESNDAARLRLSRMQRSIDKMRLERAFLLEQLEKRNSTNVEDSEGSPSPPPTPEEKPMRSKRGHRKPSFLNIMVDPSGTSLLPGSYLPDSFSGPPLGISPTLSSYSHHTQPEAFNPPESQFSNFRVATPMEQQHSTFQVSAPYGAALANTAHARTFQTPLPPSPAAHSPSLSPAPHATRPSTRPKSGFEFYCGELRSVLTVKNRHLMKEGTYDVELALAKGWHEMNEADRAEYEHRYKKMMAATAMGERKERSRSDEDEDVEMEENDVEESGNGDGGSGGGGGGGFTAVNRS